MGTTVTPSATDSETPVVETTETVTPPLVTDETSGATTTEQQQLSTEEYERVKASLKRANAEAKTYRQKADELDKLKADLEASKLSEKERLEKSNSDLQKKFDDLTRQHQERTVNYEVQLKAAQMGIVDPDAASKLLDHGAIEYDATGSPTNVDDLLKDLIKLKPYLAGKITAAPPTSGGATNPSRSQSNAPSALSEDVISRMGRDEYMARRVEVQQWRAANPRRF
jgi:hypothetical protein